MQRIIELDSQILSSIQSCPRKTEYNFVRHIRPITAAPALERGGLMHDLIEIYYGIKGNNQNHCINLHSEVWKSLIDVGLCREDFQDVIALKFDREKLVKFIQIAGEFRGSLLQLDLDTCADVIYQFKAYEEFYKNDDWSPLVVEETGSKIIYEDSDFKFIYTFKIDRVMQRANIIAPFDTKTGERNSSPSSMSNQFIGYCWALGVENIVVDKIGFQKTLKPVDRFRRYVIPISTERQNEWVEIATLWIFKLIEHMDQNIWPQSMGPQCDVYSGCFYRDLCEASPSLREDHIKRNYKISEKWDPSKHLEIKKEEKD